MNMKVARSIVAIALVLPLGQSASVAADDLVVDPQALVFEMEPTVSAKGTTIVFDFPDAYYSNFIQIQYGSKIASGLTLFKTFDRFALAAPNGKISITSPLKLKSGQEVRVRIGARFVKSVTIK